MSHFNRKIVYFAVIILLFLFSFSCSRTTNTPQSSDLGKILSAFHNTNSSTVLVTAHRAGHDRFPENSIAAIERAIEIGADIVEVDTRVTKDGVIVLMHDENVKRTTNGSGKLCDLTFQQVQHLQLKNHCPFSKKPIRRVPTLRQALLIAKGRIMVDFDMKSAPVKTLVDLVHETATGNHVLFFTRNFNKLDSVVALDSTLLVMPRAKSGSEVKRIITRYHPKVVHIDKSFFTPEVVAELKQAGTRIWINSLGIPDIKTIIGFKKSAFMPLIGGGANILQTDRPRKVLAFLRERQLHW